MLDLVIIGSGPAGLSAAIYASRAGLDAVVLEKAGVSGGQVLTTYEVDNYPGLPGINGFDLGMKFKEHADKLGAKFEDASVLAIRPLGAADGGAESAANGDAAADGVNGYVVVCDGKEYETKGVIIASGAHHANLNVPGEAELQGMGVSYCATCDGAFFRGRDVAVAGGGDVALEDAIFLARICNKVYLIHRRDEFRANKALQEAIKQYENIVPVLNCTVEEIKGTDSVNAVSVKNKITGEVQDLAVSGIFIAVGIIPDSDAFKDLVDVNEKGYILAGEDGRTSRKRIYAAGDVRSKALRQIVTAVADGANAVTSFQEDVM
jgi:thioredoxin reductase (NADPH)